METNSSARVFVSLKRNKDTELSALNWICKLGKCYLCLNSSSRTVKSSCYNKNSDTDVESSLNCCKNFPKLRKNYPAFGNISTVLDTLFKEGEKNCRKSVQINSKLFQTFPWCSSCLDSLGEITKLQKEITEREQKIDVLISQLIALRGRNVDSFLIQQVHEKGIKDQDQELPERKERDDLTNFPPIVLKSPIPNDYVEVKTEIEDFDEELFPEFSIPYSPPAPSPASFDAPINNHSEKYSTTDNDCSRMKGRPSRNKTKRKSGSGEKTKPEKAFPCSKCGKKFTSHRYCIAHQVITCKVKVDVQILTNLNLTFYNCEWENCTAIFYREKDLIRHSITHTGEKVGCPQCGKTFSRKDTLKKHAKSFCDKRININDVNRGFISKRRPPFQKPRPKTPKKAMLKCPKCPKRFVLLKTLDLHLTRHPIPAGGVNGSGKSESLLISSRARNVNSFLIQQVDAKGSKDQERKGNDVPCSFPTVGQYPISKDDDEGVKTEIDDFNEELEFSIPSPPSPAVSTHGINYEEECEKYSSSDDDNSSHENRGIRRQRCKTKSKTSFSSARTGNLKRQRGRRSKYNIDLSNVDESNPVCPHCSRKFNSIKSISQHILRKHLKIMRHTCAQCDKQFFALSELKRHKRSWHSSSGLIEGEEEEEEEKSKPKKSFPCSKCGKKFTSHRYCIAHQVITCKVEVDLEILTKLNMTFYHCEWENCTALFHREKDLTRHSITHTGEKVTCPQCGKTFSRNDTLKKHAESSCDKRIKTNDDSISKTRPSLKKPRPKTPKEAMLKCPKCPKRFVLLKTLDLHLTRHPIPAGGVNGKSTKSVCHLCGKLMNDYQIPIHIKQVHEKKNRFFCKYCGKGCFTKLNLNAHIKSIHERDKDAPRPEKRIQCDKCSNMFATTWGLNDHVRRVHAKITKYNCEVCDMKFYHKNDLRKHGQKHSRKNGKANIYLDGTDVSNLRSNYCN